MADIVLSTCNATWHHPAFGLRCLRAALGDLRAASALIEFDLRAPVPAMADRLLAENPRLIGLGVYIWNVARLTALAAELKRRRPEVVLALGGPEISHETGDQPIAATADAVICGEGERAFADLAWGVLRGGRPARRVVEAPPPDLAALPLPYGEYDDTDIARRTLYVETSRGCPFRCAYCLSARDRRVRNWPLDAVLPDIDRLLARGARRIKFVDRTFNLDPARAARVLDVLRPRARPGVELHFELVPRTPTAELRRAIAAWPPGTLRFEVGVQSFDPAVCARIGRSQDPAETEALLRFLRRETGATVHADLIAGLPGETPAAFAAGFDRLYALAPHEIQAGLLKRLRGAPLAEPGAAESYDWNPAPPYEARRTPDWTAGDLRRLARFGRLWERLANRRRFPAALPLVWDAGRGVFEGFAEFADWTFARHGRDHALPLDALLRALFDFLTGPRGMDPARVARALHADYTRDAHRSVPRWLREAAASED